MSSIGFPELFIIMLIVFLLFGVNKIPQMGKNLGEGIRNFRSAFKSIGEDVEEKPKSENR
jgi:sec-independent protein translocase protein TatA